MPKYILAIDQGTTSTRAMLFDQQARAVNKAQHAFQQYFPQQSWVEHDPEEIWQTTLNACREVIKKQKIDLKDIAAIGISNQRETTIIWDKKTGRTIYPAIVWQDRRTQTICEKFKKHEAMLQEKTGLLLDPYFSATKIIWLLENVTGAREKAEKGELAFGTIDSFLLWRLTGGQSHFTDVTNASRTLLFNLHTQSWDEEILALFNIPKILLPEIKDNCTDFGVTEKSLLGAEIPIAAMAGDQQAASFGQMCFEPGMMKSTYGTGCFVLLNTGEQIIQSKNRLLSTVAYRIKHQTCFALEGSIFMAGAVVQWLRDNLGVIKDSAESERLASSVASSDGVCLIPAFTGLGAPHWRPDLHAAILGMTRATKREHIVRAALESVAYQTKELLDAMLQDGAAKPEIIKVDGGMAANQWFLQFLSDMLQSKLAIAACLETTDLGVALMAGLQVGFYESLEQIKTLAQIAKQYLPQKNHDELYIVWSSALQQLLQKS